MESPTSAVPPAPTTPCLTWQGRASLGPAQERIVLTHRAQRRAGPVRARGGAPTSWLQHGWLPSVAGPASSGRCVPRGERRPIRRRHSIESLVLMAQRLGCSERRTGEARKRETVPIQLPDGRKCDERAALTAITLARCCRGGREPWLASLASQPAPREPSRSPARRRTTPMMAARQRPVDIGPRPGRPSGDHANIARGKRRASHVHEVVYFLSTTS